MGRSLGRNIPAAEGKAVVVLLLASWSRGGERAKVRGQVRRQVHWALGLKVPRHAEVPTSDGTEPGLSPGSAEKKGLNEREGRSQIPTATFPLLSWLCHQSWEEGVGKRDRRKLGKETCWQAGRQQAGTGKFIFLLSLQEFLALLYYNFVCFCA